MVENIEDVQSDFERDSTKERKFAAQADVHLGKRVACDRVAPQRAGRTGRRKSKRGGIQAPPAWRRWIGYLGGHAGHTVGPPDVVESLTQRLFVGQHVDGKPTAHGENAA
jgi:hypothetical protein